MKLSTRTRYGTRLMIELGRHYGQAPLYLKDIAKSEDISEKYLSQIIIPLRNAGLVDSFRGAKGGYVLGKTPDKITMKDIVAVLEGDFNLVKCVQTPRCCSRVSICVTHELWANMGKTIKKMLNAVTLAELVKQCNNKKKHALAYNI